jgi:uracil-DNA glycosylase
MTDLFTYKNEKNFNLQLGDDWKDLLKEEIESEYFDQIIHFLLDEEKKGKNIYPPFQNLFNALNLCSLHDTKVVIIGQDPYHGEGQAHGLCFSVSKGVPKPPSLVNIFKEIEKSTGLKMPEHGDLSHWAKQGVLLLNSILSVQASMAGSHQKIGWQEFTDAIIQKISDEKEAVIFLLWGRFAGQKADLIDEGKHYILKAAHPSPFSAHNGFFGCNHFVITNEILKSIGRKPIRWNEK